MSYQIHITDKGVQIELQDDCLNDDVYRSVQKVKAAVCQKETSEIRFVDKGMTRWDSTLLAFIYGVMRLFPDKQIQTQKLPKDIQCLISLTLANRRTPQVLKGTSETFLEKMGGYFLDKMASLQRGCVFLNEVWKSLCRFFRHQAVFRSVDFWTVLEGCAPKAVGIVCLISMMVGLILAFVGAIQLKSFGAQIYVSSLVTIGMTRIMGAIMVGIIMAGRTGASYAATIGTMQVNEELDALKTMGLSRTDFLILPRLIALVITMPFLVILADFMGMIGGGLVGVCILNLSLEEYIQFSTKAFDMTNFIVGIVHGIVYGGVISLCGCYFGMKCGRDSGSVGIATTQAVVYSIVWMIVMTGLLTLLCEAMGI